MSIPSELGHLAMPINCQGKSRWYTRLSNSGPLEPESYALPLRHTGATERRTQGSWEFVSLVALFSATIHTSVHPAPGPQMSSPCQLEYFARNFECQLVKRRLPDYWSWNMVPMRLHKKLKGSR